MRSAAVLTPRSSGNFSTRSSPKKNAKSSHFCRPKSSIASCALNTSSRRNCPPAGSSADGDADPAAAAADRTRINVVAVRVVGVVVVTVAVNPIEMTIGAIAATNRAAAATETIEEKQLRHSDFVIRHLLQWISTTSFASAST